MEVKIFVDCGASTVVLDVQLKFMHSLVAT